MIVRERNFRSDVLSIVASQNEHDLSTCGDRLHIGQRRGADLGIPGDGVSGYRVVDDQYRLSANWRVRQCRGVRSDVVVLNIRDEAGFSFGILLRAERDESSVSGQVDVQHLKVAAVLCCRLGRKRRSEHAE